MLTAAEHLHEGYMCAMQNWHSVDLPRPLHLVSCCRSSFERVGKVSPPLYEQVGRPLKSTQQHLNFQFVKSFRQKVWRSAGTTGSQQSMNLTRDLSPHDVNNIRSCDCIWHLRDVQYYWNIRRSHIWIPCKNCMQVVCKMMSHLFSPHCAGIHHKLQKCATLNESAWNVSASMLDSIEKALWPGSMRKWDII